MQFTITGKSLNELYAKNPSLFFSHWWADEKFADEKPEAGEYEAEALFTHYKNTGERLMPNWYTRTSVVVSYGLRVDVGRFDERGLVVDLWVGGPGDSVGVSSSRKLSSLAPCHLEPPESLRLIFGGKEVEYRKV